LFYVLGRILGPAGEGQLAESCRLTAKH